MFRVFKGNSRHHIRTRELAKIHFNVSIIFQCQNPHHKSISNISESKTPSSLTVDYLVNSCGLPPETALSASKNVRLISTEKADSVLTFFRNNGFTKNQITVLISKRPSLLIINPDKILKPKIDFLHDLGFSEPNIAKLLTSDSTLLKRSLQKQIIPSFNFIKGIVGSSDNILTVVKRSTWVFIFDLEKVMGPNIAILRDQGVPEGIISKLLTSHPRALMHRRDRFKEMVEVVRKMGLDSLRPMFVHTVRVLCGISKSSWERKWAVFRSFGWSEDEILSVLKKQPLCFLRSESKIRSLVEFSVEKLKWKPGDILPYPNLFLLSLEKRIIPRCAVLEILNSKGLIKRKLKVSTVSIWAEKKFLDKFVIKHRETIPEVVKAHKGEIEFAGFEEWRDGWG